MEEKYIIYAVTEKEVFSGSDWVGAYFTSEKGEMRLFDSEGEALTRLSGEANLFPMQFKKGVFAIMKAYCVL